MSIKKTFIIKEAFGEVSPDRMKDIGQQHAKEVGGGKTVFLVTWGDARAGGATESIIGVYTTHEKAMDAADKANREAGVNPEDDINPSALIDEIELDQYIDWN